MTKKNSAAALSVAISLGLIGCTSPSQPAQTTNGADAMVKLQKEVDELKANIGGLQDGLNAIAGQVLDDEARWKFAELDPTNPNYQRVDSDSGIASFAVSIEDVRSFGDGVRVRLTLGDLSSAAVSGVTLKLKYGKRKPSALDPDWQKSLHDKTEEVTTDLRPGHWNPVYVTLPMIDARDFGYLKVSISNRTISLPD